MHRSLRIASATLALGLVSHAARAGELFDVSIAEVFYDAVGADDQLEWIELANDGELPVDLGGMSLGWGGATYTSGRQALEGTIEPGGRFVVGGPLASEANASPRFDLAVDLESDLQNGGATADGVALFDVPAEELLPETIPVSVVLYGETNESGLLDPNGAIAKVDVADAPAGSSIERGSDGVWRVQPAPTPGAPPAPVSEPAALATAVASLGSIAALWPRRSPAARRAGTGLSFSSRGSAINRSRGRTASSSGGTP